MISKYESFSRLTAQLLISHVDHVSGCFPCFPRLTSYVTEISFGHIIHNSYFFKATALNIFQSSIVEQNTILYNIIYADIPLFWACYSISTKKFLIIELKFCWLHMYFIFEMVPSTCIDIVWFIQPTKFPYWIWFIL